jgi:hypothetical protein
MSQGVKKSFDLENAFFGEKAFFGRDPPKLVFAASFDYT